MMHDFHVGMKVVCADARDAPPLSEGQIYEVRAVYVSRGYPYLALVGLFENDPNPGWNQPRFRPLEEKPDAIEVFRQIARDVTAGKVRKLVGV